MNKRRLLTCTLLSFALLIIAFSGVSPEIQSLPPETNRGPALYGLTDKNSEIITPTPETHTDDYYLKNQYQVDPAQVMEPPD
jgi:hypothetical protein